MPSPYSNQPYSPWDLRRDIPPSLAYALGLPRPTGPGGPFRPSFQGIGIDPSVVHGPRGMYRSAPSPYNVQAMEMEPFNQFPEPIVEPELEISQQELRGRLKAARARIKARAGATGRATAAGGAAFLGQLPPFLALSAGAKVAQNYLDAYDADEGLEGVAARNQPDAPYVSAVGGWIGGLTAGAEMRAQEARRKKVNAMRESLIKSGWGNMIIQ